MFKVLIDIIRLIPKSNPDPLPWTYCTTLTQKSSREPISRTTPHYHENETIAQKTRPVDNLQLHAAWLAWLGGLLWEKVLVNVWEDTTLCDGDVSQKLVQLLIVADGELEVTWDDTSLLVVAGSVSS